MSKRRWKSNDNSMEKHKIALRTKYLPENARVLDLFCGKGKMYQSAYKGKVLEYRGIDKEKIHDPEICVLANNQLYVKQNDISRYNVFDLDDYGAPWKLFYLICRKQLPPEITVFITDGLVVRLAIDKRITKIISAIERIPPGTNIPGINRFYTDIFGTMLKDIEKRYGWKTDKAVYFYNNRASVCYWALKLRNIT